MAKDIAQFLVMVNNSERFTSLTANLALQKKGGDAFSKNSGKFNDDFSQEMGAIALNFFHPMSREKTVPSVDLFYYKNFKAGIQQKCRNRYEITSRKYSVVLEKFSSLTVIKLRFKKNKEAR